MSFKKIFEEQLEQRAYPDAEVMYSLSSCQGDGVSFTGKFELLPILEKLYARGERGLSLLYFYKRPLTDCKLVVTRGDHHYFHEHSTRLDFCEDFYDFIGDSDVPQFLVDELDAIIKSDYIGECKRLESQGYSAIFASVLGDEVVYRFEGPSLSIQIEAKDSQGHDITDFLSGDADYDDEDIDSYFRGEVGINCFDLTITVAGQEIHSESRVDCYPADELRAHVKSILKDVLPGLRSEIKQALRENEAIA